MGILLISRGSMSGARMVADCLSQKGGLRCITREDLTASVNQYGDIAARITTEIEKAARDYQQFSELRRPYKILMKRALLEYALEGDLAYFGNSGHLLLDPVPHMARVRLVAPLRLRIRRTMERMGFSEEEAREYIREADEERIRWSRFMYGADIRVPELYDLCVNMDRLSAPGVCDLIMDLLEHKEFDATAESLTQLEDCHLAAQVLAALVTRPDTLTYEIGATCKKGQVRLEGPYLDPPELETVDAVARSVPGVKDVLYEPGYAPAFPVLPEDP